MAKSLQLEINGKARQVDADPEVPLLYVLRENLDLTGTKYGCGEGQCGACTVMVDGVARRSCLTPVGSVAGKKITTIEGLASNGRLGIATRPTRELADGLGIQKHHGRLMLKVLVRFEQGPDGLLPVVCQIGGDVTGE